MSRSLNRVTILGNLARDPEARSFSNGGKVVNLRVVTNQTWKDREGNRQESAEYHSVAIFNERLADVAERFLRKGSKVLLEGRLETRKWQDQSGQDRYSTEVVLRQFGAELVLLDAKGSGEDQPAASPASPPAGHRTRTPGEYPEPQGKRGGPKQPIDADLDSDIPF